MTANPLVARPSDTVADVVRRMNHLDAGVIAVVEDGRILIVDGSDRLTGIVSVGDVAQEASARKASAVLEDIAEAPANN